MTNRNKILGLIILALSIILIIGYFRFNVDSDKKPIITEFSVTPENPIVGETAVIKISVKDDKGIKGFELSIDEKKIQVDCNNKKTCFKQLNQDVPEMKVKTITLRLVVVNTKGKQITQQKQVVIIHKTDNPVCGNDLCETGENNNNCPQDCLAPILTPTPTFAPTPLTDASLFLNPSSKSVDVGDSFTVDVRIDTDGKPIVAVSAFLEYDTNKLTVVSIDTSSSDFNIEAEKTYENGVIKISRGKITPGVNNSNALIARINFKAKASGTANVDFQFNGAGQGPSRLILDDGLGTDILKEKKKGIYNLN